MGSTINRQSQIERAQKKWEADQLREEKRVRMILADKIVLAIIDRISADIIRPGPVAEERECYVMAEELRSHSAKLKKLVSEILRIEAEETKE